MINNEADGIISDSLENRYQNLELMKGSLSSIMLIYCIINVIK